MQSTVQDRQCSTTLHGAPETLFHPGVQLRLRGGKWTSAQHCKAFRRSDSTAQNRATPLPEKHTACVGERWSHKTAHDPATPVIGKHSTEPVGRRHLCSTAPNHATSLTEKHRSDVGEQWSHNTAQNYAPPLAGNTARNSTVAKPREQPCDDTIATPPLTANIYTLRCDKNMYYGKKPYAGLARHGPITQHRNVRRR